MKNNQRRREEKNRINYECVQTSEICEKEENTTDEQIHLPKKKKKTNHIHIRTHVYQACVLNGCFVSGE